MTRKPLFPTLTLFLALALSLVLVVPVTAHERDLGSEYDDAALSAVLAVPVGADGDSRTPPPLSDRTVEPFVAVGVLDLVTHRSGQTIFGLGLAAGRIEVTCTASLRRQGSIGSDSCDALAERLLGSLVLVRGREILAGGEHVGFRSSSFVAAN